MTERAYLEALGDWLRNERASLQLDQADVARGIGVSAASVSNWELGKTPMTVVFKRRLQQFFKRERAKQGGSVQANQQ